MITTKKARNGKASLVKYFIFAPWLLTIVILLLRAGGIHTVDLLFQTSNGMPMLEIHGYAIYFGIVLLFVLLTLAFGNRTFCHTLCWMAPFMVIGTKIKNRLGYKSLRLSVHPDACVGCKLCTKNCPMGLDVEMMVKANAPDDSECVLCGLCADSCKKGAISFGLQKTR